MVGSGFNWVYGYPDKKTLLFSDWLGPVGSGTVLMSFLLLDVFSFVIVILSFKVLIALRNQCCGSGYGTGSASKFKSWMRNRINIRINWRMY